MSPSATLVYTNGCLPLVLFENKIGRKWACSFINYSLNQVQQGWDEERVYSFKRAPDSARSLALGTAAFQQSSLPCSSPGTVSRARKAASGWRVDGRLEHTGFAKNIWLWRLILAPADSGTFSQETDHSQPLLSSSCVLDQPCDFYDKIRSRQARMTGLDRILEVI